MQGLWFFIVRIIMRNQGESLDELRFGFPAALATAVGVLTEVPVMPALCLFANKTRRWFH